MAADSQSSIPSSPTRGRPQNDSLWAQLIVSPLPGKLWSRKGSKRPAEDRKIQCERCNWQTSDSAKVTSTSNMKIHLAKHGVFLNSIDDADNDDMKINNQYISDWVLTGLTSYKLQAFTDDDWRDGIPGDEFEAQCDFRGCAAEL
ncbi:hypothetical protein V8E54_001923 [Elaphomyces granulatus]